jgi:hypothetical protein
VNRGWSRASDSEWDRSRSRAERNRRISNVEGTRRDVGPHWCTGVQCLGYGKGACACNPEDMAGMHEWTLEYTKRDSRVFY